VKRKEKNIPPAGRDHIESGDGRRGAFAQLGEAILPACLPASRQLQKQPR